MAATDDESEYAKNYSSDDRTNELEQTLVQVAATVDPDARNSDDEEFNSRNPKVYDHESSINVHNKHNENKLKAKRIVEEKASQNQHERKYWEDEIPFKKNTETNKVTSKGINRKRKHVEEEGLSEKDVKYSKDSVKRKQVEEEYNAEKGNYEYDQLKNHHNKTKSTELNKTSEAVNRKRKYIEEGDTSKNDVEYCRQVEGYGTQKGNYDNDQLKNRVNKRKSTEHDEHPPIKKKLVEDGIDNAKIVATHYNALEEKGLEERSKSRILYLRNFHNWIKSMLINEYLTNVKDKKKYNEPVRVHDMCCGKGGDLLKWRKGNISHLICSDIASVALEHCKTRYQDMANRSYRERNSGSIYTIEYIAADCSKVRLREKYKDPSMKLDIVSCQFGFHYSFESLSQAECMMKNAAECLQPGGFFIGTIPDANELLARVRKSDSNSFGNDVYNIIFECNTSLPPLFGAKYHFYLDGSVDCPEFLIYFPLLVKLAKKYGLKLVKKEKFHNFYERMKFEGRTLLTNVKSLETYPALQGVELVGNSKDDYEHAKLYIEKEVRNARVGTLSKSEWEATSLYLTFAFEKVKGTWNADGVAVYNI